MNHNMTLNQQLTRYIVPLLLALFAYFAWNQRGIVEDGFFMLRIVDVFLHGGGLAYNPGELGARSEANTDFLWTLLLIPGMVAGLDGILWMQILGVGVYVLALWVIWGLTRKLFPTSEVALLALVLLGTHYSFAGFAATGFGVILQALAAVCALAALWRFGQYKNIVSGLLLGLALAFLALCRLDSIVLGAPVAACALYFALRDRNAIRPLAWALGIPAVISAVFLLWKLWYYGDIFPAPYYIKAAVSIGDENLRQMQLPQGIRYLKTYWETYALWLVLPFALFGWGRWSAQISPGGDRVVLPLVLTAVAMVLCWHGYTWYVGGDFVEFRFLMPQAPALLLLFAAGLHNLNRYWRWAVVIGAVVASFMHWRSVAGDYRYQTIAPCISNITAGLFTTTLTESPEGWRTELRHGGDFMKWQYDLKPLGTMFAQLGPYPEEVTVAYPAGGLAGYSARLRLIEQRGFVDRRIGKAGPDKVLFENRRCFFPGHHIRARVSLLTDLGVNLVLRPHTSQSLGSQPHNFDHGAGTATDPQQQRLSWVNIIVKPDKPGVQELPPDSQLFWLPRADGRSTPVLYLNRNQTIDRILDEHNIQRTDVFANHQYPAPSHEYRDFSELSQQPKKNGTRWNAPGNIVIARNDTLKIRLSDKDISGNIIELSLDNNDDYAVIFKAGDTTIWQGDITASRKNNGLANYRLTLPADIDFSRVDTLEVKPLSGDGSYAVGHIRFLQ